MISIEIANLDIFLGELFAAVLRLPVEVGQPVYLSSQSAFGRLDMLRSAIDAAFIRDKPAWGRGDNLLARAKKLVGKRHAMMHEAWGTSGGYVTRRPLKGIIPQLPTQISADELAGMIRDLRDLIGDVRIYASELQTVQPPPSPAKSPGQSVLDLVQKSGRSQTASRETPRVQRRSSQV